MQLVLHVALTIHEAYNCSYHIFSRVTNMEKTNKVKLAFYCHVWRFIYYYLSNRIIGISVKIWWIIKCESLSMETYGNMKTGLVL